VKAEVGFKGGQKKKGTATGGDERRRGGGTGDKKENVPPARGAPKGVPAPCTERQGKEKRDKGEKWKAKKKSGNRPRARNVLLRFHYKKKKKGPSKTSGCTGSWGSKMGEGGGQRKAQEKYDVDKTFRSSPCS